MYKKILLLIIIFFPLWFSFFIGYPIVPESDYRLQQKEMPHIAVSKRCFGVGDFEQFTNCFAKYQRVYGISLWNEVTSKTNQISSLVTCLLGLSFFVFILISFLIIVKM